MITAESRDIQGKHVGSQMETISKPCLQAYVNVKKNKNLNCSTKVLKQVEQLTTL